MRIDFREERKWKLALAYNLSTAVLEWHAAGSLAERVARGICVMWKRPAEDPSGEPRDPSESMEIDDAQANAETQKSSLMLGDYGSDDDDDDDQEKDPLNVVDALDTSTMVQDSLDAAEEVKEEANVGLKDLQPKTEEVEDTSALENNSTAMDVDQDAAPSNDANAEASAQSALPTGLKTSSDDPILSSAAAIQVSKSTSHSSNGDGEVVIPKSKSSKIAMYAAIREKIAFSDLDKLFIDTEDFRQPPVNGDQVVDNWLPPSDLRSIFPDLQPFALFDVPTNDSSQPLVETPTDGKKKSDRRLDKDDTSKRFDETTHNKIWPVGQFMYSKPTLLGPLQPAKHWKNGEWFMEENPVSVEPDVVALKVSEDIANGMQTHVSFLGFHSLTVYSRFV